MRRSSTQTCQLLHLFKRLYKVANRKSKNRPDWFNSHWGIKHNLETLALMNGSTLEIVLQRTKLCKIKTILDSVPCTFDIDDLYSKHTAAGRHNLQILKDIITKLQ